MMKEFENLMMIKAVIARHILRSRYSISKNLPKREISPLSFGEGQGVRQPIALLRHAVTKLSVSHISRLRSQISILNTQCPILLLAFLLSSCAQIVNPSGGPKDVTPPKIVKSIPENGSVNFESKTASIFFDEYIQLRDLNSQLIVSPPLEKMPDIKVKGKAVTIEFQEPLKESTTYTISLGNAICDITEGNPVDNFQYIFSTGDFLDSLSITGKINYAFDTKTEKGILIMLYDSLTDSVPYKIRPSNFAKTSDNGSFRINNIRNGQYKVFALKDLNTNYIYDSPEESIGFIDSTINLQENDTINLLLFKEAAKKQFLKKAFAAQYGKIVFIFNKPPDSLNIRPINFSPKKEWKIEEYTANHDTLNYWLLDDIGVDTLKFEVSDKNSILDTAKIKLITQEQQSQASRRGNKFTLNTTSNIDKVQPFNVNNDIVLEFSHPIRSLDTTCISLKEDSVLAENYSVIFDEHTPRQLLIKTQESRIKNQESGSKNQDSGLKTQDSGPKNQDSRLYWKESTNYQLFIPPGTFTDIFGLPNDTLQIGFKTQALNYYGNLKLKIVAPSGSTKEGEKLPAIPADTLSVGNSSPLGRLGGASLGEPEGAYILQLLDERGTIVRENYFRESTTINYENLLPGKYNLKIIYDTNKNLKWDTGNYLQHIQPEKSIYYPETITIRSDWDIDVEWNME